jgi:hypothetical protein
MNTSFVKLSIVDFLRVLWFPPTGNADRVNIGAFCLRMRENRSVRLQMADFKGFVSFVMVFMKNMD